jgi:hypothetical protein
MENKDPTRRGFIIGAGAFASLTAIGAMTGCTPRSSDEAASDEETDASPEATSASTVPSINYTHFASGGVQDELTAQILMENSNSTFTKYQVAYTSCTCRDAASNYRSVMYVELLNTKDTADDAAIRIITYTQNDGYNVGLWGDSNPIHNQPTYTQEYMDENFVQRLVGVTKLDVDSWGGYGTQLPPVAVDSVAGATVSTGNITSVLKSLFEYHAQKYYDTEE